MEVKAGEAPAHAGGSIVKDRRLIGTVTSAAWGYRTEKNIAMAFVEPNFSEIGSTFDVEMLGKAFSAEVVAPCLYEALSD